ncbi:DUF563-containing protein [Aureococcus anophagefferens]|nr:DUF563-containing protein [Aureococcus anophagefferens]
MGASGSLPTDWGSPGVNGGLEASASDDEDRVPADALNSAPGDVVAIEAAVVLFDAREGHKMFWHHQAECVSRLALVLARLFDRDGSPAAHLPQKTRAALQRRRPLPSSLTATVRALVRAGHGTARALERSRRLRPYEWRAGRVYSFHTAFVFDWPPPTPNTVAVEPEIWYPRTNASTVSVMVDAVADGASAAVASPLWLLELADRTAESETRRYVDSLFRLHFVPTSVIYYSRADCDKRHVRSEEALVTALTARFSGRIDVLPWQGGASPDVSAPPATGAAALVVGPHGAGLANMIHCLPGTTVLVLPAADGGGVGAPSASDEYFAHFALALDLDLNFFRIEEPPLMFSNYSSFSASEIDAIVDASERAVFPRVRS